MINLNRIIKVFLCFAIVSVLIGCAATQTRESTGQYVDDSVITTQVKTLLANDDFLKSFQISVETYKGTVQLSGFVNSEQAAIKQVKSHGALMESNL